MKTYILQHKNGRVILDQEKLRGAEIIETIEAENWIEARNTICEFAYEHRRGYGYVYEE